MSRRKTPVLCVCGECGQSFEAWAAVPERCPLCRAAHETAMRRARQKRYYAAHKDRPEFKNQKNAASRLWREKHPDEAKASFARYRAAHPEECRQSAKAWRQAHPEQCREYGRKWRAEHPEECRQANKMQFAKRRAARLGREGRDGSAVMRVLARGGLLQECPRLHVKARELPCGQRAECFGKVRCGKCPDEAMPPRMDFGPMAAGVI